MAPKQLVEMPLGLLLHRTARAVKQSFEQALAEAGGSVSAWQVLVLVRSQQWGAQTQLAEAMGITGATLTHHLNALETKGLVRRHRSAGNRRVQTVELTDDGEALFAKLRGAAQRHDQALRSKLTDEEATMLTQVLARLATAGAERAGAEGDER